MSDGAIGTSALNPPLRSALRAATAVLGDPRHVVRAIRGLPRFVADAWRFTRSDAATPPNLRFRLANLYPRLGEWAQPAALLDVHYFYQDVWAARHVYLTAPRSHVDVGSRIDGLIAHLLTFREVEVVDLRPLTADVRGLHFISGSITRLPFAAGSRESVSSLHVVEHVGLGRYGDAVDPQGWLSALSELRRVLAPGGRLYLSVPVGRQRVEFNAHRVFDPKTIIGALADLRLVEFAAVDDDGRFVGAADPADFATARYACGMFLFELAESE